MRQLCDPVWREAEEEAAEDRRGRVAGEVASEQERTKPRQHVRQQQRDVIAEDRVAGREVHRQHQQCLRDEMFGVRECERSGMEDSGVPPLVPRRPVARCKGREVLGRPPEDPGIEDRIPRVPRHGALHRRDERPRPRHREQRIEHGSPCCASPGAWPLEARGHAVHPSVVAGQFVEDDLNHRRRGHREQSADDAEQRRADEERDEYRDRADADLLRHDLRHQHVVFELLLDDEEDRDATA